MRKFTEEDYLRVRDSAFSLPVAPAVRRHEAEVASRDERAARRAARHDGPEPATATATGGTRRSTRSAAVAYAESSPTEPVGSSSGFESPESETYSPEPRGTKRKRTAPKPRKVEDDEDEEMEDAASRSRSITPAPPIKKQTKKITTLADSDDEMEEPAWGRESASRSRSATPAPPVKRRKTEGKRKTVLEDSDDEME